MSTDPRVRRSRAAVLDAATALLVDGGVGAVTIEAVAARSGVAKTTIYRHWEGKDELLLDVLGQLRLELEDPPEHLDPASRVRAVTRQLVERLQDPRLQRLLPIVLDARTREALAPLHDRIHGSQQRVFTTVLADAVAAGALGADTNVTEAWLQVVGPLTTAALYEPEAVTEAYADRLVEALFAGHRAPKG